MKILFILLVCCLSACASIPTTIELPDGSCYIITSEDKSIVNAQLDGVGTIGVDKTGGDSDFKWFLINAMNQTQINVGDGGDD